MGGHDLRVLEDVLRAWGAPALWVHGRVPAAADYRIGRTRVLANPRRRQGNRAFDPALVVWSVKSGAAAVGNDGVTLAVNKNDQPLVVHGKHTQLAKDAEELVGEFDLAWPTIASRC